MSKVKILAISAAVCALLVSCSKGKEIVFHADFYSAGAIVESGVRYACCYRDDTLLFRSSDGNTFAKDIFYENGDVYMGGCTRKGDNMIPTVWVNGAASYPFGENSNVHGCINALRHVGSKLVLAGYLDTDAATEGEVKKVAFVGWDAEIQWQLDSLYDSEITDFVINEGSNMYFCGYKGSENYSSQAFLWTLISSQSEMEATALCRNESYATSVYAVGLNVAVAFVCPQEDGTNSSYCNLNAQNYLVSEDNAVVNSVALANGCTLLGGNYEDSDGRSVASLWSGSYVVMYDKDSGADSNINAVAGYGATAFQIGTFNDGVRGYWGSSRAFTIPGDEYCVESLDVVCYWTSK